jgi:hypothetical protein
MSSQDGKEQVRVRREGLAHARQGSVEARCTGLGCQDGSEDVKYRHKRIWHGMLCGG